MLACVPALLLVCVGGFGEPLDDDGDIDDGAIVDGGAVGMPGTSEP